jgi:hypothetical protein
MEQGDPRKKLAYEESIRALQLQSGALDDLRARTGILLAALALTATFLGSRVLDDSGLCTWSLLALLSFAASGIACLSVLWPSGDWHFTANARTIIEDIKSGESKDVDEMFEVYALSNQEDWETNKRDGLDPLVWRFRVAVLTLILQVGFWLVALA